MTTAHTPLADQRLEKYCGNCIDGYPGGPDNCSRCDNHSAWQPITRLEKHVAMSPWRPISNPFHIRRLGKLQEELSELQKAVARCLIQGLDGTDPDTGEPNLTALWKEAADVQAQIDVSAATFRLPVLEMAARALVKRARMDEWEAALAAVADPVYQVRSVRYLAGEVLLRAVGEEGDEVPQSLESGQFVRLHAAGGPDAS